MPSPAETLAEILRPLWRRYFAQTGRVAPSEAVSTMLAARLWRLIEERGLPAPLAPGAQGEPEEMSAEEVASMLEQLLAGFDAAERDALAGPVRQVVKACFYGEFKVCRDSFREVSAEGSCRRQELKRARERICGSHCVDCPYWTGLEPEQHWRYLMKEWRGDPAELAAHRTVFLPEDFRVLRRFVRSYADSVRT